MTHSPENTDQPRFEFRTFGQNFEQLRNRMARLSVPVPEHLWKRTSKEIYIVSSTNETNNTKIRDGQIDVKRLEKIVSGLEQWKPILKAAFPISDARLSRDVFPAFKVKKPLIHLPSYSLDDFMALIQNNPYLLSVRVKKERYAYSINNTICEFAYVWINGAQVSTIGCESTEIKDVKKALSDIGLDEMENINYLQAIKRVTGMSDKTLANE